MGTGPLFFPAFWGAGSLAIRPIARPIRGILDPMNFQGLCATAVTPWGPGETVDEAALWRQMEMLLAAGVDGICVAGSTGEFTRLETASRRRLLEATVAMVAGRVPVFYGAAHASLQGTVALLAAGRGAAAAVVCPPCYFPYRQAEVMAFYRQVAAASPLPVLIYHIPQFTTGVDAATARELLASGVCAGIKDSSGDLGMLEALAELRRCRTFLFLCGADQHLARALELGADGALSGIAACAPELLVGLYRAARAGDSPRVARANALLAQFIEWMERFPAPIAIRMALEVRGIPVGPHAVPLSPESQARAREFTRWLEDWFPQAAGL